MNECAVRACLLSQSKSRVVYDEQRLLPSFPCYFFCADCIQNTDQKVTCTWNQSVAVGAGKQLLFRVVASKAGVFQNRATVFTTVPGVTNQTATAPVTVTVRMLLQQARQHSIAALVHE
jgi:hypothetical protein